MFLWKNNAVIDEDKLNEFTLLGNMRKGEGKAINELENSRKTKVMPILHV